MKTKAKRGGGSTVFLWVLVIVLLLGIAGAAGYFYVRGQQPDAPAAEEEPDAPAEDGGSTPPPSQGGIDEQPEPETPEQGTEKLYKIWLDTLGNGGTASISADLPAEAAAGDTVQFSIELLDGSLEVTRVVLSNIDEEIEEERLQAQNGIYAFTMPACDVTITVYLMSI